jgi:hypothetical protein
MQKNKKKLTGKKKPVVFSQLRYFCLYVVSL